jgi:hypothetical protein
VKASGGYVLYLNYSEESVRGDRNRIGTEEDDQKLCGQSPTLRRFLDLAVVSF